MRDDVSIARRFGVILIFAFLALAAFAALLYWRADLAGSVLPGRFGFGIDPSLTGNYLVGALLLLISAVLILVPSFFNILSRLSHGVLVGPKQLQNWLHDDGAIAVLAEEQTAERDRLSAITWFFLFGALLLAVAVPLATYTYAKAAPDRVIFRTDTSPVPNDQVTPADAALSGLDQIASGILIGIPDQYDLRFASVRPQGGWYKGSLMVLRAAWLAIFLLVIFAMSRARALKKYVSDAASLVMADVAAAHEDAVLDMPMLREDVRTLGHHHQEPPAEVEQPVEEALAHHHHVGEAAPHHHHTAAEETVSHQHAVAEEVAEAHAEAEIVHHAATEAVEHADAAAEHAEEVELLSEEVPAEHAHKPEAASVDLDAPMHRGHPVH